MEDGPSNHLPTARSYIVPPSSNATIVAVAASSASGLEGAGCAVVRASRLTARDSYSSIAIHRD